MKKTVLFLILILFGSLATADQQNLSDQPSILILYSSHPGDSWEDAVHHALMDEIKRTLPGSRLSVEYLDTKRFTSSQREAANLKRLEEYKDVPLSLILAVDDNALSFLSGPASGFRPELPLVFCGVGDYDSIQDSLNRPHTGVMNRINLADTLDLAYRLIPELKKVFVISDSTPSGFALETIIRDQAGALRGVLASLEFRFFDSKNLTTDELLSKTAMVESDSILLFANWVRDGRGEPVSEKKFLARLKGRCSVPVFNLFHKRSDILGGRVASGDIQASYAVGQMAAVLNGTPAGSIPIVDDDVTAYVVSAERMTRWDLSWKDLPAGTEILGDLSDDSRIVMVSGLIIALIGFLLLIFFVLLFFRRNRRYFNRAIRSDNAMSTLLDKLDDALVLIDEKGCIVRLNPAAVRISGWSEKDALGKAIGEIFPLEHESRGTRLSHPVDQVLAGSSETVPYGSMILVRRNGKRIHIESSTILLKSPLNDSVEGAFFLFRDVSHMEKMQEILYNEQRRLRDAQAMALIGNWEYNPETDEYWYSREVYTLTKTDPSSETPPVLDFMKQFFPDWQRNDPLPEAMQDGTYRIKSLVTIPRVDGSNTILHLMARKARNPENGKMIVTGILQDFSELTEAKAALKSSQEQLRQAARMEAVGKLAGGIAHEFNNLLQIILGYGQLLTDEVENEQLKSYVEPILKTASSARNLTRQLLLFSRKENLDMKPLALSSLIRGMVPLLSRLIGEDILLEHDLESGEDWVVADNHQIEQVIINLCLNARDAMPGGGALSLSQDIQTFVLPQPGIDGLIPAGSYVHLCVRDNGKGIKEEVLPQIFDPFFTTKGHEKGTGLGLSLVYGIIRQHLGFLNVETGADRGTSFHVYLPKEDIPPGLKKELKEESGDRVADGWTVFMAEDDPMVRQLTETMLRKSGFEIQSFSSGKELIEHLNSGQAPKMDLFLLDVIMPEVGGVEAFHKLRSMGYDRPVLFMSGYTEEKLRNLNDLENASLIRKPFTMKDLVGRIRELIGSES